MFTGPLPCMVSTPCPLFFLPILPSLPSSIPLKSFSFHGVPAVVQWVKNLTAVARVAAEVQVGSPAWCGRFKRVPHWHSCRVSRSCGSHSIPGPSTSICICCGCSDIKILFLRDWLICLLQGLISFPSQWLIMTLLRAWYQLGLWIENDPQNKKIPSDLSWNICWMTLRSSKSCPKDNRRESHSENKQNHR